MYFALNVTQDYSLYQGAALCGAPDPNFIKIFGIKIPQRIFKRFEGSLSCDNPGECRDEFIKT
jgi:hypothetical protein